GAPYPFSASFPMRRSAGFQTCCAADFQVGWTALRPAGLETRGTADLEVCATLNRHRSPDRVYFRTRSQPHGKRLPIICSGSAIPNQPFPLTCQRTWNLPVRHRFHEGGSPFQLSAISLILNITTLRW